MLFYKVAEPNEALIISGLGALRKVRSVDPADLF